MAHRVEQLVAELKWDTNRTELTKARGDADKLKAATKQLEAEQKKSGQTTQKLRERLTELKVALDKGLISQKEFKKQSSQARLAIEDEANESRRAARALGELREAHKSMAAAARLQEKAENAAAAATAKAGREAAKAAKQHEQAERAAMRAADRAGTRRQAALARENRATARGNRQAARETSAGWKRVRGGFGSAGSGAGAVFGGTMAANAVSGAARTGIDAVVGGMTGAVGKAVAFESEMADVAKVVDGLKTPTGEATAAYHALTEELKTLSTRIAVAPEGLAKMAAAAGQAGIKGAELTRFVEDAAKTMVAFDITSEEAGNGLAKLRANLALDQDQVMGLAGTMNVLSNSMASTAAEVLDATLRVGAVGKAAGLSGEEVAGLSSAMIASGATSEIAATATKNFILAMGAGVSATRRQRAAFKDLGLDAGDVAKQFTGTVEQRLAISRKVIESMGKLSDDRRVSASMQLFGRESLGPIASLTTDIGKYNMAMDLALDKTAAASSVQNEYNVRSATTANALELLKNRVSVVAIEIGEGMMPAIREIVAEMGEWLGAAKASGKGIGEVLGDGLRKAWAALKDFLGPADELPGKIKSMVDAVVSFASALATAVGWLTSTPGLIAAMGVAALGLVGPLGAVGIAGAAAGAGIAVAFIKARNAILGLEDGVGPKMQAMLNQADRIRHKETQDQIAAQRAAANAQGAEAGASLKLDARRETAKRRFVEAQRRKGVSAVQASRQAEELDQATRGYNRRLGGGTQEDRVAALEGMGYSPSAAKVKAAKEAVESGGGGRKKGAGRTKKDMSAYEQSIEAEIDRLSKESGKRAGIKASVGKGSRAQQYAAAKAAEVDTREQLRGRVDAGMPLPGQFHHNLLQDAGFSDVAGRGTQPPIAVSIVKVEAPQVNVSFTGPVTADPRQIRDVCTQVFHEALPIELAAGIREAKMPVVY